MVERTPPASTPPTPPDAGARPRPYVGPRSAGYAGIAFAVLFLIITASLREGLPKGYLNDGGPTDPNLGLIHFGVAMAPFACVMFLWFTGVVRSFLANGPDPVFSVVLLGSAFFVMVALAVASAMVAGTTVLFDRGALDPGVRLFASESVAQLLVMFATRMWGVYILAVTNVSRRGNRMPKPLIIFSFAVALALLVVPLVNHPVTRLVAELAAPTWVFVVSVFILRHPGRVSGDQDTRIHGD
jgi:hypothetical protein